MPGLLDITDDPNTLGLLSLGLRLMSTPGKFGTALGQAGMGALGDLQQARQMTDLRKLREQQAALQQAQELRAQQQFVLQQQLGGLQLNQAARADAEARAQKERDDAFIKSLPSPQAQALQALGTDASPTMANAARMPAVDPRNQFLYEALQARQLKPMEYLTATAKDDAPIKLGPDEVLLSGRSSGYKTLAQGLPKASDVPSQVREYEYAVKQGYKGSFQQFQLEQKRAGAANVNVNTAQNPFYEGIGKAGVEQFKASQASAEEAARRIPQNMEIQKILDGGQFFSGSGADWKLGFGKAAQAAGLNINADAVKNTELLSTQLAQRTLATIRSSGLGAGNGFSNADREFLQKAVGGTIALEPATMKRLIELDTRAATAAIQKHNQAATKIQSQPAMQAFPFDFTVPMPNVAPTLPSGSPAGPKFLGFEPQ